MNNIKAIEAIEANPFYQQILADSFGGIMYDVANRNKYDEGKDTLLKLWEQAGNYQESAGGIMKGAMSFLKGDEL